MIGITSGMTPYTRSRRKLRLGGRLLELFGLLSFVRLSGIFGLILIHIAHAHTKLTHTLRLNTSPPPLFLSLHFLES